MRRKTYNRGHRHWGGSCWSVCRAYLMVSIGIGLFAATRVHNTKDFVTWVPSAAAGGSPQRSSPPGLVRRLFYASSHLRPGGSRRRGSGPFGSSMCLIIAGIFFSCILYKLNIITLGDFYRMRYNRTVEVVTTLCIVASPTWLRVGPDQGPRLIPSTS